MDNRTIYYTPVPPKPAVLLVLESGRDVCAVPLRGEMLLGREAEGYSSDIRLHSEIAGRRHGVFLYDDADGSYYYRDNNSLNGTFYNGVRLERLNERGSRAVKLSDGDVLRIDRAELDRPHPHAVLMLFSTAISADVTWHRFSLAGLQTVPIGRTVETGIILRDFMVSGHHAQLIKTAQGWEIKDCGSKNGLAVNRTVIEGRQLLKPFDIIRIANTTLIFLQDEILYHDVPQEAAPFRYQNRSVIMRVNLESVSAKRSALSAKKILLKNIDLNIEAGDFILVLGGAGAGKSTFIKAITGQLRSTASYLHVDGRIELDGMDLYRNLRMLKHKIGIVPQYPDYRFDDTVYHTILDAAQLALAGDYSRREITQRVEEVIGRMMLTQIRDSKLGVISGGQRKRVQVAIKAVGDTSFFTLDEPDAGLDVAGRKDQMNQLKDYISREESVDNSAELRPCTESGSAVLVISHYPDDVAHMYKKVIVLAKSRSDDAGHLAYYGDVPNALTFFGVEKLSDIVMEINYEGGKGRADEFIRKFEETR